MHSDVEDLPDARTAEPPPRIAVAFVRPIAHGLGRLGVAPRDFLASVGLPPDARDGYIPIARLADAVDDIARQHERPDLALELVRMVPLGSIGPSDYCFSTSATLRDALMKIASHIGAFTESMRFELHVEADEALIAQRHLYRPLGILTEVSTGFAVRRLRDVLGEDRVKLRRVRFMHRGPASSAPYEAFFGVPVEFGAKANDFSFPRDLLDAPLLTADPALARLLADHPGVLSLKGSPDPLVDRVRAAISEALAMEEVDLGLSMLARRAKMSSRTLQRRLEERGISVSVLVDEARRDLAQRLLAREGLLLSEIAFRLGFGHPPAFYRAFRRWTGVSPQAFRKDRKAR